MLKPKNPKQFEELGRTVAAIFETGYINKKQMLKMSFLKGIASGFGGVIGATVVVALFLWVVSLFSSVSIFETVTDRVENTVNSAKQ